jgi:hypothetical protein
MVGTESHNGTFDSREDWTTGLVIMPSSTPIASDN